MDEHQEHTVALGLRQGSADAWRTLYDAFAERVWRCAARLMGPCTSDVADVVQETFLAAARSARTFDAERGTLWFWLWGIARRHVALHYRKLEQRERMQKVREGLLANGTISRWFEASPVDALANCELAVLVRSTLAEMPAEYEMLLTAKYFDSESVEQIAKRERTTVMAIRSKLARAREAFREAFSKHAPLPDDRPAETRHDPA